MDLAKQNHLNYNDRINMGGYYTQNEYVDIVWDMIKPYIDSKSIILDTSCGYGSFLEPTFKGKKIANDIDSKAINIAKNNNIGVDFFNKNALKDISRTSFNINSSNKLCIIGNPPYNDKTSIIRHGIKSFDTTIDKDIKTRDLGISFLLSYEKLSADIVCVLHPLSYLIKPANFKLLKKFSDKYKLKKAYIISSGVFNQASKSMQFPIVIALYQKNKVGMSYQDILNFSWTIDQHKQFSLNQFNDISNYIKKYPNKNQKIDKDAIFFWTMRDINALKRNKTFVNKYSSNTIIIDKSKLDYYIYVDVFKQFAHKVPYYFGNCNVMIDNNLFAKYKKYFILEALSRHSYLRDCFATFDFSKIELLYFAKQKVNEYFQQLLGMHYVSKT